MSFLLFFFLNCLLRREIFQIYSKSYNIILFDLGRFVGFLPREGHLFYNHFFAIHDIESFSGLSYALTSKVEVLICVIREIRVR